MSAVSNYDATLRDQEGLEKKYQTLFRHLNERDRRLVAAADALALGYGGISMVSRASGFSRVTIGRGSHELKIDPLPIGRARRHGGGRRPRFTDEHLQELEVLLSQGVAAHGWVNNLWTLARVGKVIKKQFKLNLCRQSVGKLLSERLGWTRQKPTHQLRERNEVEIQRWKTEEFERIKRGVTREERTPCIRGRNRIPSRALATPYLRTSRANAHRQGCRPAWADLSDRSH